MGDAYNQNQRDRDKKTVLEKQKQSHLMSDILIWAEQCSWFCVNKYGRQDKTGDEYNQSQRGGGKKPV